MCCFRGTLNLRQFIVFIKNELLGLQEFLRQAQRRLLASCLDPDVLDYHGEQLREIVDISGTDEMRLVTFRLP